MDVVAFARFRSVWQGALANCRVLRVSGEYGSVDRYLMNGRIHQ